MPRLDRLETAPTDSEYRYYGQLLNNPGERTSYATECKFPYLLRKSKTTRERLLTWGIIGFLFVINACFLGAAIAFTIFYAVNFPNYGGHHSDSPGYALYKNTRFEECYKAPALLKNCTAIQLAMNADEENHIRYLATGSSDDWCETISCFSDYKVVPSTPRKSAIWPSLLTSWAAPAGFVLGSLFQQALQYKSLHSTKHRPCKRLRDVHWYSWIFIAFDLVSFIWWWATFGKLIAAPDRASTPFIVGWVVPWKYGGLLKFHPFSCAFGENRVLKNIARGILFILAAMQWAASAYVVRINGSNYEWGLREPNPSYDCVQSQIDAAPGTSTCSAAQICSRSSIFVDRGYSSYTYVESILPAMSSFVGLSILAICPLFTLAVVYVSIRWREPCSLRYALSERGDIGPIASSWGIAVVQICLGPILVGDMVKKLNATPEAAVNMDLKCQAIHVALSPWRYYFDVDYEKGWRIAKLWFKS